MCGDLDTGMGAIPDNPEEQGRNADVRNPHLPRPYGSPRENGISPDRGGPDLRRDGARDAISLGTLSDGIDLVGSRPRISRGRDRSSSQEVNYRNTGEYCFGPSICLTFKLR